MKIQVLQSFAGLDIHGSPGQVIDMEKSIADDLIRAGMVKPVEESVETPKKPVRRKRETKE